MENQAADFDLACVRRAQRGDEESLSLLTQQVTAALDVYIYRLTLNRELTEDLFQDSMLGILKRLPAVSFDGLAAFWAWTYRTARGTVQHHYRKQARAAQHSFTEIDFKALIANRSASLQTIPEQLMRKERLAAILAAMLKLKLEHRDVLVLRCLQSLSYAQIADVVGGTELRARLLFLRARRSLHRQLQDQGFDRKHLLSILGLFAWLTASSRQTAQAVGRQVAVETLQAGGWATGLHLLSTIPGVVVTLFILGGGRLASDACFL